MCVCICVCACVSLSLSLSLSSLSSLSLSLFLSLMLMLMLTIFLVVVTYRYLEDSQAVEGLAQYRREAFGSKAQTDKAVAAYPKISACIEKVASNANIQKWLATRGEQRF